MKKAIIFDCDNTLWDGIAGEGNIIPDETIQSDIVFLANHGVIIGLCSKNNEDDVLSLLKSQTLTEDYISVRRINWKEKPSNMREIAQELNIGLDAIVFVDDSLFERNLMKTHLPEILTIEPDELMKTVAFNFDLTGDITKTRQYKENHQRARYQEQFTDISDYLRSLDMVLTVKVNDKSQIPRIAELTQKTNQFNLTTQRLTETDIRELMIDSSVYSLSVRDKFGDNGLTGVCIIVDWDAPLYGIISVFLLSCRILGRGIEFAFMDAIMRSLKKSKYTHLYAEYIPTPRNKQVELFYPNIGFERCTGDQDEYVYCVDILKYKYQAAKHFCYE